MKDRIATDNAPKAIGPYSQGIRAGGFVFVSGQIPLDPQDGRMPEGIEAQTERCLKNVEAVLGAAGRSMDDVVDVTVYLTDMNDFAVMNSVYERFFRPPCPARVTVEVSRLPRDARVEIRVTALAD